MPSIKNNIAYKGLLTFSNYIIGFVTFPYITRILGPENFGMVNYAMNTVDYFLLFSTLGITTIGTREIASVKRNQESLNLVYSKIFGLNLWCTLITIGIYISAIIFIPQFDEIKSLLYIGIAKILISVFAVDWFFTGMENFRYITIRSLIIKVIYILLVFILINRPDDFMLYFELTIGSIIVNSLINFVYASKFVRLRIKYLISTTYFKQNLKLGMYVIMTSMYITFNVMYLGLVTNNLEVGYYSTAVKLYFIILSLFSAYTSVMMPRMTALIATDNYNKFQNYIQTSFRLVLFIAIPLIGVSMILSPQIIYVLSGTGYQNSVTPMRILMPALIFVWMSQVIVLQGLVPLKKDNILLRTSIIGAIAALILNFILTPKLGAIGSAIVLLTCEIIVTTYYFFIVRRKNYFELVKLRDIVCYMVNSIPYLLIAITVCFVNNPYISLSLMAVLSCILFSWVGCKRLNVIISQNK